MSTNIEDKVLFVIYKDVVKVKMLYVIRVVEVFFGERNIHRSKLTHFLCKAFVYVCTIVWSGKKRMKNNNCEIIVLLLMHSN